MSYKEELEGIFNGSFGGSMQEAFIKCLFDAYRISHKEAYTSYYAHEAHDFLPFLRWIKLRSLLRDMGGRFDEIEATSAPNGSASSYHIRISTSQIILTVSSADSIASLPRPASHRREYANQYQYKLALTPEEDIADGTVIDPKVYAILTHGPKFDDKRQPAFAIIGFPGENCDSYIHQINLFEKFKELVSTLCGNLTSRPEEPARLAPKELESQIIKNIMRK